MKKAARIYSEIDPHYERRKDTAIAVLHQRGRSLYGLPIDRFIRACGLKWSRWARPCTHPDGWRKLVSLFTEQLKAEGIISVQKTFPLIKSEPYRVYLRGDLPSLQYRRNYQPTRTKRLCNKQVVPVNTIERLAPKEAAIKRLLVMATEPVVEYAIADLEYLLLQHSVTTSRGSLLKVSQHLRAIGVFSARYYGNRLLVQLVKPEARVFTVGDRVCELPGTQSERFGRVLNAAKHPVHDVIQLRVKWDDGTESLSSSELAYRLTIAMDVMAAEEKVKKEKAAA